MQECSQLRLEQSASGRPRDLIGENYSIEEEVFVSLTEVKIWMPKYSVTNPAFE